MVSPLTQEFWDDERRRFWEAFGPLVMDILMAGGQSGAAQLPPEIQPLINWTDFNANAIKFLREYELNLYNELTLTTRRQVVTVIEDWLGTGQHLDVLKAQLDLILNKTKADTVAITEVTRIFSEGNQAAWKATGFISAKKWQTARDDRVCPLCAPLHNTIVELETTFNQSAFDIAGSPAMQRLVGGNDTKAIKRAMSLVKSSGESVNGPPRHYRCRCWVLPVVSVEDFRRSLFGITGHVEQFEMIVKDHLARLEKRGAILVNYANHQS